jgi:hemerythrin superfamily protein
MKATDLLKQQHREVEKLFSAIESADAPQKKAELFRQLATKLVGHDGIEREIFYPACEEAMGMTDLLGEALVEHGLVEFSLYQADSAIGQPDFDFKCTVLKEIVQHHVEEEEKEFFPKVEKAIGDDSLELLAEEMEEAFEDATSEDFHGPLYENLRQVLVGVIKPTKGGAGAEPKAPRKPVRKSA